MRASGALASSLTAHLPRQSAPFLAAFAHLLDDCSSRPRPGNEPMLAGCPRYGQRQKGAARGGGRRQQKKGAPRAGCPGTRARPRKWGSRPPRPAPPRPAPPRPRPNARPTTQELGLTSLGSRARLIRGRTKTKGTVSPFLDGPNDFLGGSRASERETFFLCWHPQPKTHRMDGIGVSAGVWGWKQTWHSAKRLWRVGKWAGVRVGRTRGGV